MYEEYWNLTGSPFRNEPDGRWFCETPVHEEALARLFYLVEQQRRCGLLYGPSGTGKSLLLRMLFSQLQRSQVQAACINAAGLDRHELLIELSDALHLPADVSSPPFLMWRCLTDHLSGTSLAHVQTVLLFDQFERADADCSRAIEHLLHLDVTAGALTVIVAARHNVAALTELADLRVDLGPLDAPQTQAYIGEILRAAGCERGLFESEALEAIFERSHGVPRAINRLCDLSLLAAMSDGRTDVDTATVERAAQELQAGAPAIRSVRLTA